MMDIFNVRLWTALITPLKSDLTPDYHSLDRLLAEQVEANNGILLLGSTGEGLNIPVSDKQKIVEHCQKKSLPVPLMVGVGGHDQKQCKEWLGFLEEQAVHSYLMVTPIYAKPNDEGQYQWFKALMDSVTRPCMLYDVPSRAGIELSLMAIKRLVDHPNFWSVKDASGSFEKHKSYIKITGKPIFCGDDDLFPLFSKNQSFGLVSVASNAWPRETKQYVEQCLKGSFASSKLWHRACKGLFEKSNPIPLKRLLFTEQRIANDNAMPPLSSLDFVDCSNLLQVSTEIKGWYKNNF